MLSPSDWIPFEWPGSWKEPALLKHLAAGPVNCILLPANVPQEIRAQAAKDFACPPEIAWKKGGEVDWNSPGDLIAIGDGVWPDLARQSRGSGADQEAGPTGAPWLDANGWLLQMARVRGGGRPVWIRSDPPEDADRLQATNFRLAVSEAYAYGARRPVWLSNALAGGVAAGNGTAISTLGKILAEVRWHVARLEAGSWTPFGRMLVLSDFSGPNEYNAHEVLNLSARRILSYRIAEPKSFQAAQLQGIQAVLYVDSQPLPAVLAAALQKFVEGGGLLLSMKPAAAALKGLRPSKDTHPRFELFHCGQGRVALSRKEWEDQYVLAQDAHLLMSRRHDAVRLFNAGSLICYHTAAPGGKRWLVHLLNYTRYGAAHQVSLQTWARIASARFHSTDQESAPLEVHREGGASEVYLPRFSVYAAVELELQSNA